MTVVEAYVGKKKMNSSDVYSQLHPEVFSFLCEGMAQNTTGNVYVPEVSHHYLYYYFVCYDTEPVIWSMVLAYK